MSQTDGPTISVVIPAYNRRETLGTTLDSLLAQTYRDWEAIIVDDGSRDDTAGVAKEYAARDARITVHTQPNSGVSRARNAAIKHARGPWLFFLDADDWITARAFEHLIATGVESQADAVYGGYVRVDEAGRELPEKLAALDVDLFPLFARTCAIAVHACLVKTKLVREVGCFDESLITCEDWDLWQRVARVGARFAAIPDYIAFYRMRADSASGSGWRMLQDGLLVIDRGHGEDPRLQQDGLQDGRRLRDGTLPRAAHDIARTYFACYAAGLEIASGHDARPMIDALGEGISGDVDPHGVAETLFFSIPVGLATGPSEWAHFPEPVHRQCHLFIEELGNRLGNHWLTFRARGVLERLLLAEASEARPRTAGRWHLIDLELEGPPPQDLQVGSEVERILCSVRLAGQQIEDVEIPVVEGWMPARVLADAVVAPLAWDILRAFLERHVYPTLEIDTVDDLARISRDGHALFEGSLDRSTEPAEALHDKIGWTVFLQELWGDTSQSSEDFYDGGRRVSLESAPRVTVDAGSVEIDIARELPTIVLRGGTEVAVAVKVAGVPLALVRCKALRGRVTARQLRKAILMATGYELCRVALREAVILAPARASGSIRERLASALKVNRENLERLVAEQDGVTVIGRAEGATGTAVSRWRMLPTGAARERLALAHLDGDPIVGAPEGETVKRLLHAPLTLNRRDDRRGLSDDSLLRSVDFDNIFGFRDDPWDYGSAYEQTKYDQTLALLPAASRALELGCAEGVFTRMLAERVGTVTAVDISLLAISRAARHCAGYTNVVFEQMDAMAGSIDGTYDLIVCSELLYYADGRGTLELATRAIAEALESGGHLLTAHAHTVADDPRVPGFDWDVPFGAAVIEQVLLGTRLLDLSSEIRTPAYRVQLYSRRRSRRRIRPVRLGVKKTVGDAGALGPEYAARFLPAGGEVRRDAPELNAPTSTRLPILMYHRVAPEGKATMKRWRTHPDDFEAQLRYLRDHRYNSLTFEQWRAASDRREPISGRSVMLTFDDGYRDFPTYAMPLLSKYGFQATMFIVTDLVGASNVWDEGLGESLELMDWSTIRELSSQGLELGSHTSLHRPLVSLSATELTRDLCRSRMSFHENLKMTARSLCYPYGLHDEAVLSIAGACGFHYGVTTNEWKASFGDDLGGLPRLEVRGTDRLSDFVAKLKE